MSNLNRCIVEQLRERWGLRTLLWLLLEDAEPETLSALSLEIFSEAVARANRREVRKGGTVT